MNPARLVFAVMPLVLLAGLVTVFAVSLERDPDLVRSVLIDRPAPDFSLPPLEGVDLPASTPPRYGASRPWSTSLRAGASPAARSTPCSPPSPSTSISACSASTTPTPPRTPAPSSKNSATPTTPSASTATAASPSTGGVYGVPETFLVDADGIIRFKHVGPLTPTTLERDLLPAMEAIRNPAS
jgi:cytochrome c biogenesis protein CcmG/thiol:disulfide interchange protein DsbE